MKRPTIDEMKELGFGEQAAIRIAALMSEGKSFVAAATEVLGATKLTLEERVQALEIWAREVERAGS